MKKLWIGLLIIIMSMPLTAMQANANASANVITVYIDGVKVNFGNDPILKNGTTFVQFRPIFEALGYQITWDAAKRSITAHNNEKKMDLTVGSTSATVNGSVQQLKDPPFITKGNTFVPVRFISEYSGKLVEWDSVKREINIASEKNQNNVACKTLNDCIIAGNEKSVIEMLKSTKAITHEQFELAVKHNQAAIAKLLISHGYNLRKLASDIQMNILKTAFENRFFDTLSMLIENGIDPDLEIYPVAFRPISALLKAIENNDYEMVKFLIDHGASPVKMYPNSDSVNNYYRTPMNLAYELKYMDIYELLANKAKIPVAAPNGITLKTEQEVREYLLKYHSILDTNLGIIKLEYRVVENTRTYYLYDYEVKFIGKILIDNRLGTGMNHIDIDQLFDLIIFDEAQKKEFFKQLREHTEMTARTLMDLLPGKKMTGGYYKSGSLVPKSIPIELHPLAREIFGSYTNQFLTWSNYTPDNGYSYHETSVSEFHWYGFHDNGNVSTDIPLKLIKIPTSNYKIAVGESFAIPYELLPANATDVELVWECFTPHIASVDANGVVIGLKDGVAGIKVYSKQNPTIFAHFVISVGDPLKM
ncbi:stalk domain-containing protein [Paenibacillus pinisoli]|uniref:stalk domain-containing protein n=1 Tax=Paenibacillus pinisoli TaxID=1276110 RepID=UPI001402F05F|nr:stalk domain-containing protein [Paenibacillus pinisoli]